MFPIQIILSLVIASVAVMNLTTSFDRVPPKYLRMDNSSNVPVHDDVGTIVAAVVHYYFGLLFYIFHVVRADACNHSARRTLQFVIASYSLLLRYCRL